MVIRPIFEEKLKEMCTLAGVPDDIDDMSDEEYALGISLGDADQHHVTAYLTEALVREGSGSGFGILVNVCNWEGDHFADYCPFNYTKDVWTNDIEELVRRAQNIPVEEFIDFLNSRD
jgi:hypothetical protein